MADILTGSLSIVEMPGSGLSRLVDAPELFLVMQADALLTPSLRIPLWGLDRIELGRGPDDAVHHHIDGRTLRLQIPDRRMSSRHAVISVKDLLRQDVVFEDLGSKNGTYLNGQTLPNGPLSDGDVLETGHTFFLYRSTALRWADMDLRPRILKSPELATFDVELAKMYAAVADTAPTDLGVLITGDSGSGKEVLARAIHALSERNGSFVVLDPGSLSEQSAERTLFGEVDDHGDLARPGLVDSASNGTLFLDEVSDLPPAWQAALLRVLQERVVPAGDRRQERPVSFRPISTSHRDLDEEAKQGRFRVDLLGRIGAVRVHIAPLRERKQDIGLLIRSILTRTTTDPTTIKLRRRSVLALLRYDWPYNVRELEATIRHGLARAKNEAIAVEHLPTAVQAIVGPRSPGRPPASVDTSPTTHIEESVDVTPVPKAEPSTSPGFSVQLLGVLEVWADGQRLPLPPSKKVRGLLAYLVATGRAHRRERLSAMFCELADQQRAALRWQLSKVRGVINSAGIDRLLANREDVSVFLDAMDVDYHVVRRVLAGDLEAASLETLEACAERFRGPFLEGLALPDCSEFEAWRVAAEEECTAWRVKLLRAILKHGDAAPERVLPHGRTLAGLVPDDAVVGVTVNDLTQRVRELKLR